MYNRSVKVFIAAVITILFSSFSFGDVLCQGIHHKQHYLSQEDGTVLHANSGLMWMKCAVQDDHNYSGDCLDLTEFSSWRYAVDDSLYLAQEIQYAGHDDWRLPSIKELHSLVDLCGNSGFSDVFNVPDGLYWTSSVASAETGNYQVWMVNISEDGTSSTSEKHDIEGSTSAYLLLVRGGLVSGGPALP
ncbi:DUF1566 domain-containing protein [Desulfurispira natronophila]|uniref:Lcl C-terminal domain-containing protein n=1 Tax=Desulfurispira natronophila TaxID=682562 RepID=A0A7W8DHP6_9BACT|nr:DUF1566 domain-containing protein [Desulfurispira natronophila]MBB5022577.1 hypothetical protein [Desulfurispira natronophila]